MTGQAFVEQASERPNEERQRGQVPDHDRRQPSDHEIAEPPGGEPVDKLVVEIDILRNAGTHAGKPRPESCWEEERLLRQ